MRDDDRVTVLDLPALGKLETELQRSVEELAPTDDPFFRIVAKVESFDPIEIPIAIGGQSVRGTCRKKCLDRGRDLDDS